jgi:hypothetical protein
MVSYKNTIKVQRLQTAMKFGAEKEIFSSPTVNPGKMLPLATAAMLKQFYASDNLSRIIARIKDYVSVNSEDKEVHLQKRLI